MLLAEVDTLVDDMARWVEDAPNWPRARTCRALVKQLNQRIHSLRARVDAPLVVATLGGTGTGKSTLINALVGCEVVRVGRARPTTTKPTLVCHTGISPKILGIDPDLVEVVHRDTPTLSNLVLIDCPDPDTTESVDNVSSNLARLRAILPYCDAILVTATQQKYRSARVGDELHAAASGARLVFVQTHADTDHDVRDDWKRVLGGRYTTGELFFVDSLRALADAQANRDPRGEFGNLVDLLTRQLAGAAVGRMRRANFVDLVDQTLSICSDQVEAGVRPVGQLRDAIQQHRARLGAQLASSMRDELLTSRRQWENRLLGRIAARWGFSPFALVIRCFQGLGSLISGAMLWRARTPAQVALLGIVQGARSWRQYVGQRKVESAAGRAVAGCWDQTELRSASIVLGGYANEIGLDKELASLAVISVEANEAGAFFVETMATAIESLTDRLAQRHGRWPVRLRYEILLGAMLGFLLYRVGKNFFYDSWWIENPVSPFGVEFYITAAFWLTLWCVVLLWGFTWRLRRGLRQEINQLANDWNNPSSAAGIFTKLEKECKAIEQFQFTLAKIKKRVDLLRQQLARQDEPFGHLR